MGRCAASSEPPSHTPPPSSLQVIAVSSEYFAKSRSEASAAALATLSFFVGAALMALIDNCVHRALGAAAAAGDGLGDNGSASPSHSHSTPLMPPPREHTHVVSWLPSKAHAAHG